MLLELIEMQNFHLNIESLAIKEQNKYLEHLDIHLSPKAIGFDKSKDEQDSIDNFKVAFLVNLLGIECKNCALVFVDVTND